MKLASFFKTLNQKINKYDKFASNPFEAPQSLILIWVEKDSRPDTYGEFYDEFVWNGGNVNCSFFAMVIIRYILTGSTLKAINTVISSGISRMITP